MYSQTPTRIIHSLHLHINNIPATIPPYLTTTVKCLQKYKITIMKNLIHRAFYISSSKTIFYKELTDIKQTPC